MSSSLRSRLRSRRSLTQPPHLALSLSCSSLLASNTLLPQLPELEDEGDIFSLADPFHASSFCLESKRAPLLLEDLSPLSTSTSTSTSTTSFDTTSTTLSSRSFSLLTPSDSCCTLADEPLPSHPPATGPITTKEITYLLALLDRLDDDVTREVVRVKAGIQDVRTAVGEYKMERSKRREVATTEKNGLEDF